MNSWFGYSGDPISCRVYDLCIIDEIEREEKEKKEKEEKEKGYVRNQIW